MTDAIDLDRFVAAQARHYPRALAELTTGAKRSHWMWFVFPQIAGLGHGETARFYAIGSLAEARAYLAHPLLGARLREATAALLTHRDHGAEAMLGWIDAIKLRSSLTLFLEADAGPPLDVALATLFGGRKDEATLRLLAE